MDSGIYKLVYKDNTVIYVGSSNNLKTRKRQHFNRLRANKHHNFIVQRVYNKHKGNIVFETICKCPVEELTDREDYYIDVLKPFANISDARGSHPHTEETKAKMRGRIVSDETRKRLSETRKGIPSGRMGIKTNFVPRSAFKKGNVPWNTGKNLPPSWNKGQTLSEEYKDKLKQAKRDKDNIIGTVYQHWTIVDYGESIRGNRTWICQCNNCGNIRNVRYARIKDNQNVVCKNCKTNDKGIIQ